MGAALLCASSAMRVTLVCAESTMTRSAARARPSTSGAGAPLPTSTMVGTSERESAASTEGARTAAMAPKCSSMRS